MLPAESLRRLAWGLTCSAEQITALGEDAAVAAARTEWDCPRGRRAVRRAADLAHRARAAGDDLHSAARTLTRAADHLP